MDVDIEERRRQRLRRYISSMGRTALNADDPAVLDGHNGIVDLFSFSQQSASGKFSEHSSFILPACCQPEPA